MNQDIQHILSLATGLRSTLNLALGIDPSDITPITANFIYARVNEIKAGEVQQHSDSMSASSLYVYQNVSNLNFVARYTKVEPWGYIAPYDIVALKAFSKQNPLGVKLHDPNAAVAELIDIMKRIRVTNSSYGDVLNIVKNAAIYGLLTGYGPVVSGAVFTILDTLEAEGV